MVLGAEVRKHTLATLSLQVFMEKLAAEPIQFRLFGLHAVDSDWVEEGFVLLSLNVDQSTEDSFWRIFERHNVDLRQRVPLEGANEEQTAIAAILQHLKPILQAYWVLLYTVLRPIYWLVVDVRSVLTDWTDPGLTILFFVASLYLWWSCRVLPGVVLFVAFKILRVVGSRPGEMPDDLDAKGMLREYQGAWSLSGKASKRPDAGDAVARDALKYGRVDPLSYKLVRLLLLLSPSSLRTTRLLGSCGCRRPARGCCAWRRRCGEAIA